MLAKLNRVPLYVLNYEERLLDGFDVKTIIIHYISESKRKKFKFVSVLLIF